MNPKVKALLDAAVDIDVEMDPPVVDSVSFQDARHKLGLAIDDLQAEAIRDKLQTYLDWLEGHDELRLPASEFLVPLREVISTWGPNHED